MDSDISFEIELLNKLDNIFFAVDIKSQKMIYSNGPAKEIIDDNNQGLCFEILLGKKGIDKCPFRETFESCCANPGDELVTKEIYNVKLNKYFELRTRKTKWLDNKHVVLGMAIDITKRKESEAALKESEEKFRSIFESFIDIYFQVGLNGYFSLVSPSCEAITGYRPEELYKTHFESILINPNYEDRLIYQIYTKRELSNKQLTLIKKDSSALPVSLNCKIIYDGEDNPLYIEGTIRDNVDRINAEMQFTEALDRAQELERMKSEFVSNMSHELRTPLNGILGFSQIMQKDGSLNEKQLEGIEIIEKSASHLLSLINDILDLSKIEANKMELVHATFNLTDLIKTVHEMIQIRANSKRIAVVLNKKTDIPGVVIGDKKRLGQVLLNLLTNAVKFTDFGTISFNVSSHEHKIRFEVADTGFGIPEDKINEIFSPFSQLANNTMKSEGTGLGLSISKKIINKMGGDIFVESTVGNGSRFWFELEMEEVDDSSDSNHIDFHRIIGYEGELRRILIVDDLPNDRKLIKAYLQPKGFEVIEASDGIDALKIIDKIKPDLILLDLIMPLLDGYDFAKELKKKNLTVPMPLVAVSACNPNEVVDKLEEIGVADYLLKPIDESSLLQVIQRVLELKWNYDKSESNEINNRVETAEEIKYPSEKLLVELNDHISRRNFSKLHEVLTDIETSNKEFIPFVRKIRKLANSFNSNQIRKELRKIIDTTYAGS
ncbi:MAG: response regulator [Melioribacteraceae bacterium]|nr:response regulator [Melioribacteraceae bacterium]